MVSTTSSKNISTVYKVEHRPLSVENGLRSQWTGKRFVIVKQKTVFVLDNDECLGAWSLASALHGVFVTYIPEKTGIPVLDCINIFKDCLVKHYFENGGSRPGTKDALQVIKCLKDDGLIDKVTMFTSSTNKDEWVFFLKDCLEQHANVVGLYDLVLHRENTKANTPEGPTLKHLSIVLNRLNFNKENTKIIMIDDRPENIIGDCDKIVVSQYRHVVDEKHLSDTIDNTLDKLQAVYKPTAGSKTFPPVFFKQIIKNLILVDKGGRNQDIKTNEKLGVPFNQMNDVNLIEAFATFLDNKK